MTPRDRWGDEPPGTVQVSACAGRIRRRLDADWLRAGVPLEGIRVEVVDPDAPATYDGNDLMLLNVNTPHGYERAQGRIGSMMEPPSDRITNERRG